MKIALVGVLGAVAACGTDTPKKFDGELLDDGYIRYIAPPVTLQPGETKQYVQWVAGPIDRDMDLLDVRGSQGAGGHHAVLYSSKSLEEIGVTRDWEGADQIDSRFLGGVGGEGVTSGDAPLPPGTVFRVPAGSGFYIQTHYLNATDAPITTESALEVRLEEPDPTKVVLAMFANTSVDIKVTPGESTQSIDCEIAEDTSVIMYVNHIHETGVSIATKVGDRMVKNDPAWAYEWTTHPNFHTTALDKPLVLKKGEKLNTSCAWNNPGTKTLGFPDEMCAFLGFYVGTKDRACTNGKWVEF